MYNYLHFIAIQINFTIHSNQPLAFEYTYSIIDELFPFFIKFSYHINSIR